MSTAADDSQARLRRSVYALLIAASVGLMLGRILAVDDVGRSAIEEYAIQSRLGEFRKTLASRGLRDDDPEMASRLADEEARLRQRITMRRPFLSANDRSRWCAIRALVEPDMRVPGVPYAIDKVIQEANWDTIDMVKHDGHLYSSKPPLLPTLAAAPYWLIHRATGATLGSHPFAIGRALLVLFNVVPMVVAFVLLARLVEHLGTSDWGRVFVMAAAAFGTFLTTFAVVLNNHLPGAISALIALYAAVRIWRDDRRELVYFAVAGLFAAFAAANELPALSLLVLLGAALLWKAPRPTLVAYLPAALVVAAGFFGTNWIAHRSLRPPYMHRSKTDPADNWYRYEYERDGRTVKSYWQNPVGIDRGEPSPAVYVVHALVGHHGVFSLTPVWILTLAGLPLWLFQRRDRSLRELALFIAALSLVCVVFYLMRPQADRNYGGMTSGFRWVFWFAPMWLVGMLPAVDRMASRRWLRGVALVLLALSILSAAYPTWNPWTHPWLFDWFDHLGWARV